MQKIRAGVVSSPHALKGNKWILGRARELGSGKCIFSSRSQLVSCTACWLGDLLYGRWGPYMQTRRRERESEERIGGSRHRLYNIADQPSLLREYLPCRRRLLSLSPSRLLSISPFCLLYVILRGWKGQIYFSGVCEPSENKFNERFKKKAADRLWLRCVHVFAYMRAQLPE